jgi:hypothetical protein
MTTKMINQRSWIERFACMAAPGGGHTIGLTAGEASTYDSHPDSFAAQHFGLTIDQYREWVRLDGAALCGATTRAGKPCGCILGNQLDASDWARRHRKEFCHSHLGVQADAILAGTSGVSA